MLESGWGESQLLEGVSQPAKGVSQLPNGASQLVDHMLLLMLPTSGEAFNEETIEALDSTFGYGSDLHKGRYFISKKELKSKLADVALKGKVLDPKIKQIVVGD